MNKFTTQIRDTVVDGKYRLGAVVRRSVAGTVYQTDFDENGERRRGVVKIRELDPQAADQLAAQWRRATELSHPNVARLYAAGVSEIEGAHSAYAVIERGDESLALVLERRTLSEGELRAILPSIVDALQYLHNTGFAHGGLKPSNVFAVGDQLKLSSDNAIRIAHGGEPVEDMRALGRLILRALGQDDVSPSSAMHSRVYEAIGGFRDMVRNCLEANPPRRWTAEEAARWLRGETPKEIAAEAPSPKAAGPAAVREEPVAMPIEPRPAAASERPRTSGTPKWVFGGLVILVLLVLLAAVFRDRESAYSAAQAESQPPPSVTSYPKQPPAPETPVAPAPASPDDNAPGRTPASTSGAARRDSGWSVIVAAYGSREAAEKRLKTLAPKARNFRFSVVEQRRERAPWMVVLGENLPEAEAEALRQKAVRAGLPHDTYIKRLK